MRFEGSFWVMQDKAIAHSVKFLQALHPPADKLSILTRVEYKNISEQKKISRLLFERYSDNSIGIYIVTALQSDALNLFHHLAKLFQGSITMLHNRGPIALNYDLQGNHLDFINFNSIVGIVDWFEKIQPVFVRDQIMEIAK